MCESNQSSRQRSARARKAKQQCGTRRHHNEDGECGASTCSKKILTAPCWKLNEILSRLICASSKVKSWHCTMSTMEGAATIDSSLSTRRQGDTTHRLHSFYIFRKVNKPEKRSTGTQIFNQKLIYINTNRSSTNLKKSHQELCYYQQKHTKIRYRRRLLQNSRNTRSVRQIVSPGQNS